MPRLMRGIARTAVVAGTATAVSGRVQRRQAEQFAERDADIYAQREAAYQSSTASSQTFGTNDKVAQLQQLATLRAQGILSDAEFEGEKAKILAQ